MKIELQHGVTKELAEILTRLTDQQEQIMADLSGITDEVSQLTTVVDSAVRLLDNLAAEIRNTAPTQEALDELATALESQRQELADAVAANIDVEPPHPEQQ